MEKKYSDYYFFLRDLSKRIRMNEIKELLDDLQVYYGDEYDMLLRAIENKKNEKKLAALLSK